MTADEFIAARKALGMTKQQMADALEVTLRTVQWWETGLRRIPGPVGLAMRWLMLRDPPAPAP